MGTLSFLNSPLLWGLALTEPTLHHLANTARVCRELRISPISIWAAAMLHHSLQGRSQIRKSVHFLLMFDAT